VWIKGFAIIANLLFALLQKGINFEWTSTHNIAMAKLKAALCSPPALTSIDYSLLLQMVILAVDRSKKG
jgi:hypothetical protein